MATVDTTQTPPHRLPARDKKSRPKSRRNQQQQSTSHRQQEESPKNPRTSTPQAERQSIPDTTERSIAIIDEVDGAICQNTLSTSPTSKDIPPQGKFLKLSDLHDKLRILVVEDNRLRGATEVYLPSLVKRLVGGDQVQISEDADFQERIHLYLCSSLIFEESLHPNFGGSANLNFITKSETAQTVLPRGLEGEGDQSRLQSTASDENDNKRCLRQVITMIMTAGGSRVIYDMSIIYYDISTRQPSLMGWYRNMRNSTVRVHKELYVDNTERNQEDDSTTSSTTDKNPYNRVWRIHLDPLDGSDESKRRRYTEEDFQAWALLQKAVLYVSPESPDQLVPGTRVCAIWSATLGNVYFPGRITDCLMIDTTKTNEMKRHTATSVY
ncbi:hypothetical protein ACTXT7_002718 [Hymenolepis weldensis]